MFVYQSLDAIGLFWFLSGLLTQPHSHVYIRPQFLHMDLFSVLHSLVLTADFCSSTHASIQFGKLPFYILDIILFKIGLLSLCFLMPQDVYLYLFIPFVCQFQLYVYSFVIVYRIFTSSVLPFLSFAIYLFYLCVFVLCFDLLIYQCTHLFLFQFLFLYIFCLWLYHCLHSRTENTMQIKLCAFLPFPSLGHLCLSGYLILGILPKTAKSAKFNPRKN